MQRCPDVRATTLIFVVDLVTQNAASCGDKREWFEWFDQKSVSSKRLQEAPVGGSAGSCHDEDAEFSVLAFCAYRCGQFYAVQARHVEVDDSEVALDEVELVQR